MAGITLGKPKEKYWVSYIKTRIKQNKNFLGFISGPTGSGKSWSSLSIGESLDPDFTIDRVVFNGRELMRLINNGDLKSGSVIVFEETGVEMNNKNWASVTNKMLNFLMQTFRHKNYVLIMNSPYMDFVDASTRKLFHAELRTLSIDAKKNVCKLKPQLIQYNSRRQKFYYKRLRVIKPEGVLPVDVWTVEKPSRELIKAYELKKTAYTDELNRDILEELEFAHEKNIQKKERLSKREELTAIQEETLEMLKEGLTVDQIAASRGRAPQVVRKTMDLIRNKGFVINPVKEGSRVVAYEVQDAY